MAVRAEVPCHVDVAAMAGGERDEAKPAIPSDGEVVFRVDAEGHPCEPGGGGGEVAVEQGVAEALLSERGEHGDADLRRGGVHEGAAWVGREKKAAEDAARDRAIGRDGQEAEVGGLAAPILHVGGDVGVGQDGPGAAWRGWRIPQRVVEEFPKDGLVRGRGLADQE